MSRAPQPTIPSLKRNLQQLADRKTAASLQRYFRTGPGEYGAGDIFIGIKVPVLRKLAIEFRNLPLQGIHALLKSKIHEERTVALMILTLQFAKAGAKLQTKLYNFYLRHTGYINNWDLVDGSAPYIVGPYLAARDREKLYSLARSASLWERRIAILATLNFIRANDFADTLKIAKLLLADEHDLIHKAVGWMLREVGKRDATVAEAFLKTHCRTMPRTALRYAIERFPPAKRKRYLLGSV